ncbi:dolichyl-phosphate beta-glucosyltransferase [Paludisphaera mucosa]|uniref:dolichyl-phosphate beta-glucosyltransferase n=1 Tax=Paludisphaera mucosa TaxID=3030827 RepID=A0ABT6FF22_9BACT|nr:dolichyl-phosphate beta-glucosyltransferase [Paludisphaera mucosa]MDG3005998.1 glycosyltransferase family 2 protein [Paludisphaera mucosa]
MPVQLSIIIPAYNEAARLPRHLDEIRDYLARSGPADYEVLVVDDGSVDGTDREVRRRSETWPELRLIRHEGNRGKGAAVRTGMLTSSGSLLLFCDADGATPIREEARFRDIIESGRAELVVGSRRSILVRRAWHRRLCGRAFSAAVRWMVPNPASDSQCGFKMFLRGPGLDLFSNGAEDAYLFDVELLAMAAIRGYRVAEVEIDWEEVPGSKVRLVRDSWRMLSGLPRVRRSVRSRRHPPPIGEAAVPTTSAGGSA